ncbi:type IV pilus biogenesis/stability protein PilW [Psychromonas ingrahamii 37]|uniref:Type IV pilus biogenesis/stability protein PilW n=1 Tax=Psychromonas ingrahamii (strain DSM 17664 / CCUG 51855 / 37) TaxID=357804 RepID=A1SU37_PSYIN|nr:type IV pilus biogenesis/stability protein PilW [Psychromonas ingrahamii]ABM03002.1 type IV pilus biogenesis/stability protein PilW [Psychromonas ingrahamii 37]
MRQTFFSILLLLVLSGCTSSATTTTTKNTGAGQKMALDPEGASRIRVKLALVYLENKQMQQAKENLEKALEYQPKDATVYRVFAYYYQAVKENEKAEQMYKKSLSLDPKNSDTYNNYGTFLCQQKRYAEADKAFLTALEQLSYSNVADTYENAGLCAEEIKNLEKALFYYQSSLAHNPNKLYLNLVLTKINITKQNYTEAQLNLSNYQKQKGYSAESLWQWIRLSYATGQHANMNKYAGILLEKFPESHQALDYLNHGYYE